MPSTARIWKRSATGSGTPTSNSPIFAKRRDCCISRQSLLRFCDPSVGTEELGHLEMVGTIVYQLTRGMTPEQIKAAGFDDYFVDHTAAVYPVAASGMPFNAATISVTGDTIADLHEDLSAEQKARMTYDNILRFTDDPDVRDPIKFLREREVVHFQRFGEANHTKLSKREPPAGYRPQGIFP